MCAAAGMSSRLAGFSNCLGKHSFLDVGACRKHMGEPIIRLQLENFLQPDQRFIRSSGVKQKLPFKRGGSQIKRVEFPGKFYLTESFCVPAGI